MTTYHAKLQDGGRIVIPAKLRKELGIKVGDEVSISRHADGALRLSTRQIAANNLRKMLAKHMKEGESLVDSLLKDRRNELRRESKKP